ncbi:hypothetical protein SynRS9902_00602 [Synechococcus sp. RS9902]|nr:hypothetical protein SynRS9902_00602 [Synechococcus sp. RS9902]
MSDARSQISVSVGQNISTSHLATAIASSERQCTPSRGDGVCGSFNRMGLPSNG